VDRGGSREKMKRVLEQCVYLLGHGHTIMIFPEGGRSRTGRVDRNNFSYGVGRFIQEVENCKVLCIYLRGDRQHKYSLIPAWGDSFDAQVEVLEPARRAGRPCGSSGKNRKVNKKKNKKKKKKKKIKKKKDKKIKKKKKKKKIKKRKKKKKKIKNKIEKIKKTKEKR
jgi:1-acyl-sn-glycerol-3-phosphate acyltransferase